MSGVKVGEGKAKGCAFAELRFHPDASAMAGDDLLADRQTHAVAGTFDCVDAGGRKIPNTFSAYCGSIPMPLSRTEITQSPSRRSAKISMRGGFSLRYLIELMIRFWNRRVSCTGSPRTTGSGERE